MDHSELLYLYPNEFEALKKLASELPPNPIVINFGAGAGNSAAAFLLGREDVFVYTIDRQKESSPFGCLEGEQNLLERLGLWSPERIQQIHGDSAETGRTWTGGKVDLVFVDAGHSYEECKADALAWLPHLREGGVMVFHDYTSPNWPNVVRAVDEVMAPYQQILHVDTLAAYRITQ